MSKGIRNLVMFKLSDMISAVYSNSTPPDLSTFKLSGSPYKQVHNNVLTIEERSTDNVVIATEDMRETNTPQLKEDKSLQAAQQNFTSTFSSKSEEYLHSPLRKKMLGGNTKKELRDLIAKYRKSL